MAAPLRQFIHLDAVSAAKASRGADYACVDLLLDQRSYLSDVSIFIPGASQRSVEAIVEAINAALVEARASAAAA